MEDINVSSLWRETDKSQGKLMNFYWDTTELNKISLVTLPEGYCWLLCRVLWQDSMAWRLKVRGSWGDWIFISLWSTLKWRMQPWKPKTIAVSCKDQTPRGPGCRVSRRRNSPGLNSQALSWSVSWGTGCHCQGVEVRSGGATEFK